MSDLKTTDKRPFELLFGMKTGYVMDFTNNTFEEFFSEYKRDIFSDKYAIYGGSKAKTSCPLSSSSGPDPPRQPRAGQDRS